MRNRRFRVREIYQQRKQLQKNKREAEKQLGKACPWCRHGKASNVVRVPEGFTTSCNSCLVYFG